MGKIQFCRICRTSKNLKFTVKQLREFNKNQLLSAQETPGSATDKASKKLLRSTPTLGNICNDCDDRIQIFHRLDDGNQSSDSDIEVDVVNTNNTPLPQVKLLPALNSNVRPETPVIVDDDDMLYNLFMQKVDQQRQQRQQSQPITQLPQNEPSQPQQFINNFNPPYTPPQSNVGSEGDDAKVIEVLTSRESTPASIDINVVSVPKAPLTDPPNVDQHGRRIVAIIDLDDGDEITDDSDKNNKQAEVISAKPSIGLVEPSNSLLNFIVTSANFQTGQIDCGHILVTPSKNLQIPKQIEAVATADDDDEEIVFRRVDPHLDMPPSKKKNRKSYDDKQLRLVASLNLVSSDSETDEPVKQTIKEPKPYTCNQCKVNFPDAESLSVHERVHQGVKCPVCQFGYSQERRLIHHMRCKHRTYNGPQLTEKPRAAQDSAMTIRLRYMQRKTFYECQLCGCIDEIFKDHKEHIISKHPIESKTLKDPIMKELKCPVCKCKCGNQYLALCRHLIGGHEYGQYKSHLRELVHASAFGWNVSRQQEVAKTARIYQFVKRKSYFFECKLCYKVVAGYFNHVKHIKKHSKESFDQMSTTVKKDSDTTTSLSASSTIKTHTLKTVNEKEKDNKLAKVLDSTKPLKKIKEKISKKDSKSCKKLNTSIEKSQFLKTTFKPAKTPIVVKFKAPNIKNTETKKSNEKESTFKKPKTTDIVHAKNKNQKPKSKLQMSAETLVKAQTAENSQQTDKSNKRKRKRAKEDLSIKSKLKKVRVKPPIKTVDLRNFKCGYCAKHLESFRLYNLHLLQEHGGNEFEQCSKCEKTYFAQTLLQCHNGRCLETSKMPAKNRRKYGNYLRTDANHKTDCANIFNDKCKDSNGKESNTKVPEIVKTTNTNNENLPALKGEEPKWLKDLLKLNESKKDSCSGSNSCNNHLDVDNSMILDNTAALVIPQLHQTVVQCCYCMHLFASDGGVNEHVKQQHSENKGVLIKFTPPPLQAKFV